MKILIWNDIFQRKKNEQKHSQDAQEKYLELEDLDSVHKVSFKYEYNIQNIQREWHSI